MTSRAAGGHVAKVHAGAVRAIEQPLAYIQRVVRDGPVACQARDEYLRRDAATSNKRLLRSADPPGGGTWTGILSRSTAPKEMAQRESSEVPFLGGGNQPLLPYREKARPSDRILNIARTSKRVILIDLPPAPPSIIKKQTETTLNESSSGPLGSENYYGSPALRPQVSTFEN